VGCDEENDYILLKFCDALEIGAMDNCFGRQANGVITGVWCILTCKMWRLNRGANVDLWLFGFFLVYAVILSFIHTFLCWHQEGSKNKQGVCVSRVGHDGSALTGRRVGRCAVVVCVSTMTFAVSG
jgi:hypothetical protein